jgi:hypothetical protein
MAHGGFLSVDLGHPFLNRTADGFLKVGTVGACKVAAEETFHCLHKGTWIKNIRIPIIRQSVYHMTASFSLWPNADGCRGRLKAQS